MNRLAKVFTYGWLALKLGKQLSLAVVGLLLAGTFAQAYPIISAEYYIGTDPGQGRGPISFLQTVPMTLLRRRLRRWRSTYPTWRQAPMK